MCSCGVMKYVLQSSNIRTVIKTPGMHWTTRGHSLRQQRWAHFSVDRKHHLLSVLSRLSPSPDWCVGVSALDLCLDNCTWLADTSVQLFAWDVGVSDNVDSSEEKETQRNYPARPIRRLSAAAAARANGAPRLPFRSSKQAEPVAVLRLHRFSPYPQEDDGDGDDAACSGAVVKDQAGTSKDVGNLAPTEKSHVWRQNPCMMGSWGPWSGCSASCGGSGTRTRTRTAVKGIGSCDADPLKTTSSEPCTTAGKDCEAHRGCEMSEWSEWSACRDGLVLCSPDDDHAHVGTCSRHRSRSFRHPGAEVFCTQSLTNEEPCQPASVFAAFDSDVMSRCFSAADAGPCTKNLLRWYYDAARSTCQTFLYGGCRGNANRYVTKKDCMQSCRHYEENVAAEDDMDDGVKTSDTGRTSRKIYLTEGTPTEAMKSYTVKPADGNVSDCVTSPWSAWTDCSVTCGTNGVRTRRRTVSRQARGGGRECPRRRKLVRHRRCSKMPACESDDCRYSDWSPWSPCARSCGDDTVQERVRRRVQGIAGLSPRRSALRCPYVKLQRRLCSLPQCFIN